MELYIISAPHSGLPTVEPRSLTAVFAAQLTHPNDFSLVRVHDSLLSPDGQLPFLRRDGQAVPSSEMLYTGPSTSADVAALHAFIDAELLPLILHTLYSLPHNYRFYRSILAQEMPAPARYYLPEQLRLKAKEYVETHADYWGLGGDSETEEEAERRKKRVLLETTAEGWKERRELEQKEARERMRRTFGENKVAQAAQRVFGDLEAVLASSRTSYFLSSEKPTVLDAQLASLLSIALFLPLPQPLLADTINASYPRLYAHTSSMRDLLCSTAFKVNDPPRVSLSSLFSDFTPSFLSALLSRGRAQTTGREKKKPAEERQFERKRNVFALVVTVGIVGWALGVGAIPLPGRPGIWAALRGDEEEELDEGVELDEDDEDDLE